MKVVVAVISDPLHRFLVTQRPLHVPHGGLWEFPGGKLEKGESPEAALIREVHEELGLEVVSAYPLGDVHHQYPGQSVHLMVYHVDQYLGEPLCLEGQLGMKWLKKNEFSPIHFPEANQGILELIASLF